MRFATIETAWLAGLVVLATANGLLWMFSIPFNEGPDEAAHFQIVRFILDHGRLPVFRPEELWLITTAKGAVETYATFPPLAYVAAALVSLPFGDEAVWGARLVSVASYVGAVALTFAIARTLLPDSYSVAASAALVVAFLPQFAFVGAYVNNDALGVLESGALYYLLARMHGASPPPRLIEGERMQPFPPATGGKPVWLPPPLRGRVGLGAHRTSAPLLVMVGLAIGALLLTKYTFYAAAGVGLVAALAFVRRPVQLAALAAAAAAPSGWWFVRSWQLYGEAMPSTVIADAKAAAGGNILFVPSEYGIDLLTLSTRTDFWWATFTSFVGKFGWLTIDLHPAYYLGCLALALLALVGIGARLLSPLRRAIGMDGAPEGASGRTPGARGLGVGLFGAAVVAATAIAAMATSAYGEYSPQGRYLFAALIPIAVGLAAGWSWLALLAPWLRFAPPAATLCIIALNFISLFAYVVPAHFGGGAERIIIQVDPPLAAAAGSVEIVGWSFREGASSWRPYSPAAVRDYRAPVREVLVYLGGPPPSGSLLGQAQYGLARPDVAHFYGGFAGIQGVGYRFELPRGPFPSGPHRIYVCASDGSAEVACADRELRIAVSRD